MYGWVREREREREMWGEGEKEDVYQDKLEFLSTQHQVAGGRDPYTSPAISTFTCNFCVQFSKKKQKTNKQKTHSRGREGRFPITVTSLAFH